ncbi:MAG: homoserine dehydrogenase [Proteobacteria bacterium]|nr:homoserine dehydrogenase [Pseudomonadota bacterium]
MTSVRLGFIGLGTVGCGTLTILRDNAALLAQRTGCHITVSAAAVRDLSRPRTCDTQGIRLVDDPLAVATAQDVDVVVELMGGTGLAVEVVRAAINAGKHVITANKALLAEHGNALLSLAETKGVMVAFEASVAGGIPIIKALKEGLSGNQINWVAGIINGTCNYMLTEMAKPGKDFAPVLKEAQRLGYAEAEPSFDIDGIDASHKLAILASVAFGVPLSRQGMLIEGITMVTAADIAWADDLGYKIKSLGIARRRASGIELRVQSALVPKSKLLANVDDVMNAVMVNGNAVGTTLYSGAGAGGMPTGSAVVADIVDVCIAMRSGQVTRPALGVPMNALAALPILPSSQIQTAYYLRLDVTDAPGVLAKISAELANEGISIEEMRQQPDSEKSAATLVLLTNVVEESAFMRALAKIAALTDLRSPVAWLRVEHLS